MSSILRDAILFPLDYLQDDKPISRMQNLTIAITHKCNIRCKMCYFHKELGNKHELSLDLYKQLIDQSVHAHPCVILSGGEPFMHPNLLDMVRYAKEKGLSVQIFTNGTLATPEKTKQLFDLGLDYINVTLLGDQNTHPQVARSTNSYNKLVANLAFMASQRAKTMILLNYTITPDSILQVNHSFELAQRFGLDGVRLQHYNYLLPNELKAQSNVMRNLFGIDPGANEIEEAEETRHMGEELKKLVERLRKQNRRIPIQWAPTLTNAEIDNWYSSSRFATQRKCLFPWRGVVVDANGKVYPCSKIYIELGDLRENDLFTIWNGPTMFKFRRRLKRGLFPACARCCKL